jgi:adenylate cyclase
MQMMTLDDAREGYRVSIFPSQHRIRAVVNGETIADSSRTLVMRETRLPLVYYFHPDDVCDDLLVRTEHHTNCPFKGNASYWSVNAGGKTAVNAAWSYEDAFDEALSVKGYIAFDWKTVDTWLCDDNVLDQQPRDQKTAEDNPFVSWLVRDAWKAPTIADLLADTAKQMNLAGLPVWRLRLFVRTLNPQLFGMFYSWQRDLEGIEEFQATHARTQSSKYLDSPFAPIINGEGGVRRKLEGNNVELDFPVLEDLVVEGATDYVAVPLRFSDGQINVLTLISDKPGGFSTSELGFLYEILPTLGRLVESHALRLSSLTLLKTYLGKDAGERVMNGLVKRGDGENVHAVIWFSDLRGSTKMADTMPREDYLAALNQYFDSVAGAILENGGEVLKFIGDAVLAIFPIDSPDEPHPGACANALSAVQQAHQRIDAVNSEREALGEPPLQFGTGLHRGNITYGNIGTEQRLDFTVIGPAVNEASRIEGLCKTLGVSLIASSAFASGVTDTLKSLGMHELRGVKTKQEIFTLGSPSEGE